MATLVTNALRNTLTGALRSSNATYLTAANAASTSTRGTSSPTELGQQLSAGTYNLWESPITFDTSSIGSTDTVTSASMTITPSADNSTTDFTINAYTKKNGPGIGGADLDRDWIAGNALGGLTLVATRATAGLSVGVAASFTDVALTSAINKDNDSISFVAATSNNNGTGATTVTCAVPTGIQDFDMMFAFVVCRAAGVLGINSGWFEAGSQTSLTNINHRLYMRRATASEASYSFGLTNSVKASVVILAFRGVSTHSGIGGTITTPNMQTGTGTSTQPATASYNDPSTYASQFNAGMFFAGMASGTTAAPPTGYTEPTNGQNASTGGSGATRTTTEGSYLLDAGTSLGALTCAAWGANAEWGAIAAPLHPNAVTQMLLASSRLASNTAPSGNEYITYANSTTLAIELTVNYSAASTARPWLALLGAGA